MRILLATDFSSYADTACALVRGLELPEGSHIRIVTVVEPTTLLEVFAPAALLEIADAAERGARAFVLERAAQLAAEGRTVEGVVRYGRAADAIVEECEAYRPDLVVIGSRGRGGISSAVLGSVSAEVVDHAPCPVLVARLPTLARIVLAEDGSISAAAGAAAIVDLAPLARCAVHVVSVVDASYPLVLADPGMPQTAVEAFRTFEASLPGLRASHLELARARAGALTRLGVPATAEEREGPAAAMLVAAAADRHADLIVIGSRSQTGLRRLLIGSVARSVLFHASCSVLVAHSIVDRTRRPPREDEPLTATAGATTA